MVFYLNQLINIIGARKSTSLDCWVFFGSIIWRAHEPNWVEFCRRNNAEHTCTHIRKPAAASQEYFVPYYYSSPCCIGPRTLPSCCITVVSSFEALSSMGHIHLKSVWAKKAKIVRTQIVLACQRSVLLNISSSDCAQYCSAPCIGCRVVET